MSYLFFLKRCRGLPLPKFQKPTFDGRKAPFGVGVSIFSKKRYSKTHIINENKKHSGGSLESSYNKIEWSPEVSGVSFGRITKICSSKVVQVYAPRDCPEKEICSSTRVSEELYNRAVRQAL